MPYPENFLSGFEKKFSAEVAERFLSSKEVLSCIRFNTVKMRKFGLRKEMSDACPFVSRQVPWCEEGAYLRERIQFTLEPEYQAGMYYVQDSSSMFSFSLKEIIRDSFRHRKGNVFNALDLCAAPGGKTTLLSSVLSEISSCEKSAYLLLSNEAIRQRAAVLADNVARWGDSNIAVSNNDPSAFSRLNGYFDFILADVPCSGEGMFRKNANAAAEWSEDNVRLCASRQRRIIADAWPSLADGGLLVYSTCTFNDEENDDNVDWVCSELGAEPVSLPQEQDGMLRSSGVIKGRNGYFFIPGTVEGEGQFFSVLRKRGGSGFGSSCNGKRSLSGHAKGGGRRDECAKSKRPGLPLDVLAGDYSFLNHGDFIKAVPSGIMQQADELSGFLNIMLSGVLCYSVKGNDLVPYPDLALCGDFNRAGFEIVELSKQEALLYMKKENFSLPAGTTKGYLLMAYRGVPLGFVKNIGSRFNNLWPVSRRIRMSL